MTPLREAFCAMMATCPGPDATEYCRWARSCDGGDARRLKQYVHDSARAIRAVSDRHSPDRAWLPILDALLAELKTGQVMAAEHVGVLLSARERCALELRAGEIVEAAFVAAEFDADYFETARAVAAVAAILGGGQ